MKSVLVLISLLFTLSALPATMPGFRVERLGTVEGGFLSSLAVDSRGILYYTTTSGSIVRFAEGRSTVVARVVTNATSNSGLLGMALAGDNAAVVHYTTFGQTYDIISRIDLTTGAEAIIHEFPADIDVPERGSSPEHHGGNPIVGPDGSVFIGIGDYGGGFIASLPNWNGGKIFRIAPDRTVTQIARGLRNPFDLIWDDAKQRVIVADNGPDNGDAITIITTPGANLGWPFSFGGTPPMEGVLPPRYVFTKTVAPTGMIALNGANAALRSGILVAAFVTASIYYFPDIDAEPLPEPVALISRETGPLIDVAQSRDGHIYFATGSAIYRLMTPGARRRSVRVGAPD